MRKFLIILAMMIIPGCITMQRKKVARDSEISTAFLMGVTANQNRMERSEWKEIRAQLNRIEAYLAPPDLPPPSPPESQ